MARKRSLDLIRTNAISLSQRTADTKALDEDVRSLLALHDRERRLLGCEIHDGFVQDCVAALLGIDALLNRLVETDREAVEQLLRIRAAVRKAVDESRRLVGELRPQLVDDLSLVEAIEFLVDQAEAEGKVDIRFNHDIHIEKLSPLLQSSLLRIVQESLHNIQRHAKTNKAHIRLKQSGEVLSLQIQDHGAGFNPKKVPADRYGLSGIRERAHVFGGRVEISSQPGKGTLISVDLPIREGQSVDQLKPKAIKPRRREA